MMKIQVLIMLLTPKWRIEASDVYAITFEVCVDNVHVRYIYNNDNVFSKIKFKIPSFDTKYDPNSYLTWEMAVEQNFTCHNFPENACVRAATSEFTDFASVW